MVVDGLVSRKRFYEPDHCWIKLGNVYFPAPKSNVLDIQCVLFKKLYQSEQP